MNAIKVINLREYRQNMAYLNASKPDSEPQKLIPVVDENQDYQPEISNDSGNVIDRRSIEFWAPTPHTSTVDITGMSREALRQIMLQICERIEIVKISLDQEKPSEVVTQSARISVLSQSLSLPRTAQLARDIGEAVMAGHPRLATETVQKLERIINSLSEDLLSEAR